MKMQTYIKLPYTCPHTVFTSLDTARNMLEDLCDGDSRTNYLNRNAMTVGAAIGLHEGVFDEISG